MHIHTCIDWLHICSMTLTKTQDVVALVSLAIVSSSIVSIMPLVKEASLAALCG